MIAVTQTSDSNESAGACLHLIDTGGPGGAETMFQQLAIKLDGRPLRSVAVVPREDWLSAKLRARGLEPHIVEVKGSLNFGLLRRLSKLAKDNDVRVIHAHLLGSSVYAALLGLMLRLPVIAVFHGPHDLRAPGRFASVKRWLLKNACSKLVAVSGSTRESLIEFGVNKNQIVIVPNGIEIGSFTGARHTTLRRELGIPDQDVLIGAVGNIRAPKAYDVLVKSAAIVLSHQPGAHFAVVGEGSEDAMRPLLALRDSLGINRRFHFLGFRKTDAELFGNFDIFVSSSRSEGLPLSFLEAWASNLPIVATRSGGAQEVIVDGETGLLVPIEDPPALAAALERLIVDSDLKERLRTAGREKVVRDYNLDRAVDRYAEFHRGLLTRQ